MPSSEAASAHEALERIEDSGANFLITDIGMASQDGYQLLGTLRDRADRPAAREAGCTVHCL